MLGRASGGHTRSISARAGKHPPVHYMKKHICSILVATVALTACGGGGGGGTPTPAPGPLPTPAPTPTPAPPAVQVAALITATAASYPASAEESRVFTAINAFRTAQGLGPVQQSTLIDLAANNHAAYVRTHQSGADPHAEIAGKANFTGVNVLDRLVKAGYAATAATEVIAFNTTWPITTGTVIDVLADSVYHRNAMIIQGMTHVGVAPSDADSPTYIDLGYITAQKNAGTYLGVYPVAGQTGLSLTHYVESPNPFYLEMAMTSENMCKFTSYPIHLASEASTSLSVTSFTVTEEGQASTLPVRLITKATSPQDTAMLPTNIAFIVGKAPFKANTKYNVRFVGTANGSVTGTLNGMPIDKSWSFMTGTDLRGCK